MTVGIATVDLTVASALDTVIGSKTIDGIPLTRQVSVPNLALQLVGSAPFLGALPGFLYATKAALDADTSQPDNKLALIIEDLAHAGLYRWDDAGNIWINVLPFVPGTQFVTGIDSGDGTPDAIQIETNLPVSAGGGQIISVILANPNTSPAPTISFNGGSAMPIKTAAGNDPVAGGLTPGAVIGFISDGKFRLLSDEASAAIVAAAEAAAIAAAASATASDAAATRSQSYAALAGAALAPLNFATVASLLADTVLSYTAGGGHVVVGSGDIIQARGFRYKVAASGASDQHLTTAGGVKLYVQPNANDQIDFAAFNPGMNSSAGDDTLFAAAVTAARTGSADGTGRLKCRTVVLPPGTLLVDAALELAPLVGLSGLTIRGAGIDNTIISFSGAAATLSVRHSQFVTWMDLTLQSSGVDDNQIGLTVTESGAEGGGTLRGWVFHRVNFYSFYKAISVGGTIMCSEFTLIDCKFAQCYYGIENSNQQAVNWSFLDCHWENSAIVTTKDKDESALFYMKSGFHANWRGGSLIFHGKLGKFELTVAGVWQRVGSLISIDGSKLELSDNGAASHAPLLDKAGAYVNGSNYPQVAIKNVLILLNGAIPTTLTQFKLWNGCRFVFDNIESEGGKIVGVLDAASPGQPGFLDAREIWGLTYEEDVTNRLQTHHQHNVNIRYRGLNLTQYPTVQSRLGDIANPVVVTEQIIAFRGNTGSLPQAGTTVNLPTFGDHTQLSCIEIERYAAATQDLTVDLRDQADTTSYGSGTILAAEFYKRIAIGKEMGYQIPSGTALMLKYTGTAQIVKGIVKLKYI